MCVQIFKEYFTKISPTTVRDNFVVVYELLDECIDNGQICFYTTSGINYRGYCVFIFKATHR